MKKTFRACKLQLFKMSTKYLLRSASNKKVQEEEIIIIL